MYRARSLFFAGFAACLVLASASGISRASAPTTAASTAPGETRGVYRVARNAREALLELGAVVRHGSPGEPYVAELTPSQVEELRRIGFTPEPLYASVRDEDRAVRRDPAFEQFHTYEQIRADFQAYAAAHPEIARFVVLGTSLQGRQLFALKISARPDLDENEPELAFWGGIHGNEYGGGELPYRYALYLCDSYGTDPAVTHAIDTEEIWCVPMINPDGRALGTRGNANGIDLNRDLGYEWAGEGGSASPFSQVESRVLREFCATRNITLSTSFHCSGDIVFYPWGYAPQSVPDLVTIRGVAQAYAGAASYGYGNSWQDYETHGELVDDLYGRQGGICLTVEVSNSSSLIAQTFARNQTGMNLLCAQAGEGIRGVVTDAATGQPLEAAVWVAGNPIPSYTDRLAGDMHRIVPAGTYTVTVWANGFAPQTVPGIVVAPGTPGSFTAALTRGGGESAFRIVWVNQRDPYNAHANVSFPSAALGAPDGAACSLGASGDIVLDLGAGHEVLDRSGNDLRVVEAVLPGDPTPESYRVYAGNDATGTGTLIGSATGTAEFNLAAGGLASARYLRIVDASGAPPSGVLAGMDLDAVEVNINADPADAPVAGEPVLMPGVLADVFPNPFRGTPALRLVLGTRSTVEWTVYDAAGRRIGEPSVYGPFEAGEHGIRAEFPDETGAFFYRVRTDAGEATGRVLRVP